MDISESTVEYRDIPTFPGYRVGSDGSVWTCKNNRHGLSSTWRRRDVKADHGGYYTVSLWQDNARVNKRVHILVLECFVGPRPPGMLGLHKNDQPLDNRLDNLYWGTPADNGRDSTRNQRARVGIFHPHCKFPEAIVHLVRQRVANGESHARIAADLQMSRRNVGLIGSGKSRRYATGIPGEETRLAQAQAAQPPRHTKRRPRRGSRRKQAKDLS